jgi:hypothetical protein
VFPLTIRNSGISGPLIIGRIIAIIVAHSRFPPYLAQAPFSSLGRIIFDACSSPINEPDSSILYVSGLVIPHIARVSWKRRSQSMNVSGSSALTRALLIKREYLGFTSGCRLKKSGCQLTPIVSFTPLLRRSSLTNSLRR